MKTMDCLLGTNSPSIDEWKARDIYLYSLDIATKALLMRFAEHGIAVSGFLVETEQCDWLGLRYLGKPVLPISQVATRNTASKPCCIVDFWGEHFERLKQHTPWPVYAYLHPRAKQVIIYGAGYQGKQAYQFLTSMHIRVCCFCDRSKSKQHTEYCGVQVISPEELRNQYFGMAVVVALDASIVRDVAKQFIEQRDVADCYIYQGEKSQDLFSYHLHLRSSIEDAPLRIHPMFIYEQIIQKKKIILYGHTDRINILAIQLSLFGIHVAYGIAYGEIPYNPEQYRLLLKDISNLTKENIDETVVWVLPEAEKEARYFACRFHIDERIFFAIDKKAGIVFKYLDANLGFDTRFRGEENFNILTSIKNSHHPKKRIGIVGNSTADLSFYGEKSWPEQLAEYIRNQGIDAWIYAGGTAAHLVSQELVKFIRDMSHLPLDILISYSRIVEGRSAQKNFFVQAIHEHLLRALAESTEMEKFPFISREDIWAESSNDESPGRSPTICLGKGIKDIGEHWFHQERMMYAICKGLGIKFYAVIQPFLFEKTPLTMRDREMIGHNLLDDTGRQVFQENMWSIRQKVKAEKQRCPWLVDFTEIFDHGEEDVYLDLCHLTTRGNHVVAEKLFQRIEHDLR